MAINRTQTSISLLLLPFLVGGMCLLIGKSITSLPHLIPIIAIISIFIFLLSFTNTSMVMMILIFAMLLSPEFGFGAISRQQSAVVRLEDLLLAVFTMAWLARTALHGKLSLIKKTPINRYIGLYIFIFIFSTIKGILVGNVNFTSGFFYILKYFEYFLIYYLVAGFIHDKKQIKQFLKAFIITFLIVNIYAFTQIGITGRVSAPFEGEGEPNTLGGYQVFILSIIIGLITHIKATKWRWPLIGLSFFTLIPFTFTLSRSSYMAIIPSYLTLIIFNKMRGRNILIAGLIIFTITSFFFFPKNIKDRLAYTFVAEEQEGIKPVEFIGIKLGPSASARIHSWAQVIQKWKRKPFLGYGVTGAGFLDSQYFRTLAELGIVGLLAFFTLMFNIYKHSLKIYKETQDDLLKGLALGFLAGHIGLLTHALSANTFILIRIMEPYWFIAAIVMLIPEIEKLEESRKIQNLHKEDDVPTHKIREHKDYIRNSDLLLGS